MVMTRTPLEKFKALLRPLAKFGERKKWGLEESGKNG